MTEASAKPSVWRRASPPAPRASSSTRHSSLSAAAPASVALEPYKAAIMPAALVARILVPVRQPYPARKFELKYQHRIMFGTDTTPRREAVRIYYLSLDTEDEYFDCA